MHTNQVIDLLDTFGFSQFVNVPTHKKGHTLDWVMARLDDDIVLSSEVSHELTSDHSTVVCKLNIQCSRSSKSFRETRVISSIDKDEFRQNLQTEISPLSCPSAEIFHSTIGAILDKHAPVTKKEIKPAKSDPWYPLIKNDLKDAKQKRRQAERKWLKSRLTVFEQIYDQAKYYVTSLIR